MVHELTLDRVTYNEATDRVILQLGSVLVSIPRKSIAELRRVSKADLASLEVGNVGATISQRNRDIDIYVPGLIYDIFSKTVFRESGREGGRQKTARKAAAVRENGKLGGRPARERAP